MHYFISFMTEKWNRIKNSFTVIEQMVAKPAEVKSSCLTARAKARVAKIKFTLIELLVVIAIIAILMTLLLPALSSAKKTTKMIACLNNEKQVGAAIIMYANDNQDYIVPCGYSINPWRYQWMHRLDSYVGSVSYEPGETYNSTPFECPEKPNTYCQSRKEPADSWLYIKAGIGINSYHNQDPTIPGATAATKYAKFMEIKSPSQTCLCADLWLPPATSTCTFIVCPFGTLSDWRDVDCPHPGTNTNVLYFDGHAKSAKWRSLPIFNGQTGNYKPGCYNRDSNFWDSDRDGIDD